jgi:ornithine cyclodeaminase/alanine dehydrogenase-like protein (mu-crystallin family)
VAVTPGPDGARPIGPTRLASALDGLPYIDHEALNRLLTVTDAADAIETALVAGNADPPSPQRWPVSLSAGQLLLMPCEQGAFGGVKVTTVARDDPARVGPRVGGLYILWDASTLALLALFDAAALTTLRTPALSVVATRRLGLPAANRLVIFGTGPQAWGHLEAMASIRPISHVTVVGRRAERVAEFVQRARSAGLATDPGGPGAVAAADIVCTCTTASQPLFDGMLLPEHAHVNAIGSHTPTARELDEATIARASVVVESRASALAEAGDLIIPMTAGQVAKDIGLTELAEVVGGALGPDRLTVFKSVGVSLADLAVASEAYRRVTS